MRNVTQLPIENHNLSSFHISLYTPILILLHGTQHNTLLLLRDDQHEPINAYHDYESFLLYLNCLFDTLQLIFFVYSRLL
eukprot:UN14867